MKVLLFIYSRQVCKEIRIPELNDEEYKVLISSEIFRLSSDIELIFYGISQRLILKKCNGADASINSCRADNRSDRQELANEDSILVINDSNEAVSIIVNTVDSEFAVIPKYDARDRETLSIGADEDCDICYQFLSFVSRKHATLIKEDRCFSIQDESMNGIYVNGFKLADRCKLEFGDIVNIIGLKIIVMNEVLAVSCIGGSLSVKLGEYNSKSILRNNDYAYSEGNITIKSTYDRRCRQEEEFVDKIIEIILPDCKDIDVKDIFVKAFKKNRVYFVFALIGISISGISQCILRVIDKNTIGIYIGISEYNGIQAGVVIGVLIMFISLVLAMIRVNKDITQDERNSEQERRERLRNNQKRIENKLDMAERAYIYRAERLTQMYPKPMLCCEESYYSNILWKRSIKNNNSMVYRVGLGESDCGVKLEIKGDATTAEKLINRYSKVKEAPVCVDLRKHRVVGITGDYADNISYAIMAQMAVNNCYTELRMAFIYDQRVADYSFARWFPHSWSEDGMLRYTAGNKCEARIILKDILKRVRARGERQQASHYVLFIRKPDFVPRDILYSYLTDSSKNYGLTIIYIAKRSDLLPKDCEKIIGTGDGIMYDVLDKGSIDSLARRLSRIKVSENSLNGLIPDKIGFLQMYEVKRVEELEIARRWSRENALKEIKAPIGVGANNRMCVIDVHEKGHGPHGIIAGMTGAGKSELLETFILSLAVNYSPEQIGFLLIDYKGGGMSNSLEKLPHVVGNISNLSGKLADRVMISIMGELLRRQELFAKMGINNINQYFMDDRLKSKNIALPHLFIIIDEFAELKREKPECLEELISVAQTGRSLGIHLILATQKPTGAISDDIKGNANFRICLKVLKREDSMDMLGNADATMINTPGRAYMMAGNGAEYSEFQTGYCAMEYLYRKSVSSFTMINKLGSTVYEKENSDGINYSGIKQIDALVSHMCEIAGEEGYYCAYKVWNEPLGELIGTDELTKFCKKGMRILSVPVGICDDVKKQRQPALEIDIAANGHYAICGDPESGRSTFLQTLIYQIISSYSAKEVNLYALDFSSGALKAYESAPQVGGVIYNNDREKIDRLFTMMLRKLEKRKELLNGADFTQYVSHFGNVLPYALIVIDDYAAFREQTKEIYDSKVQKLIKEGKRNGICFVLSALSMGRDGITAKVADYINSVIALNMQETYRYCETLRIARIEIEVSKNIKGRGVAYLEDELVEFQTAIVNGETDAMIRMKQIEQFCIALSSKWSEAVAEKINVIPKNMNFEEFESWVKNNSNLSAGRVLIGYDADKAVPYGINMSRVFSYIVSGKKGSGKTNLLKVMARSLSNRWGRVYILDNPDKQELKEIAYAHKAEYIAGKKQMLEMFERLAKEYVIRNIKKTSLMENAVPVWYEEMGKEEPIYIFISDMKQCMKDIYSDSKDMVDVREFVENIASKGKGHNIFFIFEHDIEDTQELNAYKAFRTFTEYETGIYMGGMCNEQILFEFGQVPFCEQYREYPPGMAFVAEANGDMTGRVVVPRMNEEHSKGRKYS